MPPFFIKIKEIIKETHDVITLRFDRPVGFDFIPGQYVLITSKKTLVLSSESLPFTVSSSPTENHIDFTIKIMGEFTAELSKLEIGDEIEIIGPKGSSLNFSETIKDDLVILSAGSGITPFISIIRYIIKKNLTNKVILLNSNKTPDDIIYWRELDTISNNQIRIINTITDNFHNWDGETGRISRPMIENYVSSPKDKLWYVCGPPPMVEAMKQILSELEISNDQIRIEEWQIPGRSG